MACRRAFWLTAVTAACWTPALAAAEPAVDYARHIKPLLAARCGNCHGPITHESNLRLDAGRLIIDGGENGPVVVPGNPDDSELLRRVTADDGSQMPPEGPRLTAAEVELLRRWIDAGAQFPADELIDDPRQHWSFRPVVRPAVPQLSDQSRPLNPIDAFIAAAHAQHGLTPNPPAPRHVLLRRLSLDLTGLPPTRDELHAFLADDAPDAYERAVDRLLASPRYGERWGRHWMDVWRYSDWYGRRSVPDVLNSYAQIWRWRDWIVHSLNADQGYNRMVRQMLAADEIAPEDDANIVATGFLVRNFYRWNYHTWMKDSVEHTGKAFLGLTFNCCECHDHKYDPISQREYFQFRAFFEPLEIRHGRVPGEPDPGPYPKYDYGKAYKPITSGLVRVVDEKLDAETFMYASGDERKTLPDQPPVPPGVPSAIQGPPFQLEPVELPPEAWYPGMKAFIREEERAALHSEIAAADAHLTATRDEAEPLLAQTRQTVHDLETRLRADMAHTNSSPSAAFHGQVLRLNAPQGRRVLARGLPELDAIADGSQLSWCVRLLDDGYVNLQLSNDLAGGRTNVFVALKEGEIRTYRPGSTTEIVVGSYRFAAGQSAYRVQLELFPSRDVGLLSVADLADQAQLVERAEIALNGFQPAGDANRGICLDAQAGTIAEFDDICWQNSSQRTSLRWNFESPDFFAEQDAAGSSGWVASRFSTPPATSIITGSANTNPVRQLLERELLAARNQLQQLESKLAAARISHKAAHSKLAALEARIAADDARFATPSSGTPTSKAQSPDTEALTRAAVQAELQAAIDAAEAQAAVARRDLITARAQPESDAQRAEQLAAAEKRLATATSAVAAARHQLKEPPADYTPLSPKYPRQSTGRRAALARWIAHDRNPLTPRVAVNHIWQRHFGTGLVETTANLGRNGKPPSHPELLDWLAAELIDSGWRMKHIHRLIVTSATYRLASSSLPDEHVNIAADRDNRMLWRYPSRRVEAEVVRDSLLHVAGVLDAQIGGHEIDHTQGLHDYRRSLYFAHHGESKMEFLALFDGANACDCYQRTASVRPQQALAMSNSRLGLSLARRLATSLRDEISAKEQQFDESRFITAAFERILSRAPTPAEQNASLAFLSDQRELLETAESAAPTGNADPGLVAPSAEPAQRAREDFLHALFSHSDFVTVR